MNGKKSSLNRGFRRLFHIPEVKRGPTRERVTELQVRVQKLPRTDVVEAIKVDLQKAARLVFDKLGVNDDGVRQKAVNDAIALCDGVMQRLEGEELKAKSKRVPKQEPLPTKTPVDGAKQFITDIKLRIETAEKKIAEIGPDEKTGRQGVLMSKDAWSGATLRGQAQGARLSVDAEVIDGPRKTALLNEVTALENTINQAVAYATNARGLSVELRKPGSAMANAAELREGLVKRKFQGLADLPFIKLLTQLEAALDVRRSPVLNPEGIKSLVTLLETTLGEVVSDPDAYLDGVEERQRREKELKAYDDLTRGPLESLRRLAEPLKLKTFNEQGMAAASERVALLDEKKPCPDGEGSLKGAARAVKIEEAITAATRKGQELRNEIKTLQEDLNKLLTDKDVVATTGLDVCALEWKVIKSGKSSIDSLMPKDTAELAEVIAAIASVKVLIDQLKVRVTGLKNTAAKAKDFEQRTQDLRTAMIAAVGSKGALKRWDKAAGEELTERRRTLRKQLSTLTLENALKQLDDIKKDFDEKMGVVNPIDTFVTNSEPELRGYFLTYNLAAAELDGEGAPPQPNAMEAALTAWETAEKARPAQLKPMQDALALIRTAFKDANTRSVRAIALDTHDTLAAEAKDKKTKAKEQEKTLNARRYGLSAQAKQARGLVKSVKGDTTEIDRVDQLLEQAKELIKAGDEAGATRTMNIITNRIGLIQAHPEGEPTRRREELQQMFNEWTAATTRARENLLVAIDQINEHANTLTEAGQKEKVGQLAKAVQTWSGTFAANPPELRSAFAALADKATPEGGQRAARETALAFVNDALSRIKAHPLTTEMAQSALPALRLVPGLLVRTLDRMLFTVSIAVE